MINIIKFNINNYFTHPIYERYASSSFGCVFDIEKESFCVMKKDIYGYLYFNLIYESVVIKYNVNKFVWECFNGVKPKKSVIINSGNQYFILLRNLKILTV